MEAVRLPDAGAFLERAGAFLLEREAEHNLLLGLAGRLVDSPRLYGDEDPYFAVLEEGGRVLGAALRTPPYNVVLSEIDDLAALEPLAAGLLEAFPVLPGVLGPKACAAGLVRLWERETGTLGRIAVAERIYRAERVLRPHGVRGRMRPFAAGDRDLAVAWMRAFLDEAMPGHPVENDARDLVERRLADPDGDFELWEVDGRPAAFAGYGSPTPNGIRVGPVYTPPALRRRGYGAALTAALTQRLLDGGRRFCFLFTDLANPTSNSIYRQVGYEPVSDVDEWRFSPPG